MKKVYVLLVALIMSATMMVQAAPLENKEVKTNAAYGTQQVHHPVHHKRHHRMHRRHRRTHHPIHH